jgi:hypothetical protein
VFKVLIKKTRNCNKKKRGGGRKNWRSAETWKAWKQVLVHITEQCQEVLISVNRRELT